MVSSAEMPVAAASVRRSQPALQPHAAPRHNLRIFLTGSMQKLAGTCFGVLQLPEVIIDLWFYSRLVL